MGFKILFVVAMTAVGVALGAPELSREDPKIDPKGGELIDWYSCEGKEIGNYANPRGCTTYITCDTGDRVWERPCAACHQDEVTCPEGMLHYNEESDKCLFADEAGCSGGSHPTTAGPTTTRLPPTHPSTTTPEPEGPTPPPRPTPGDECVPDNCTTTGWCQWYDWCGRDDDSGLGADHKGHGKDGYWYPGTCSQEHNLYFNPDRSHQHGGVCDFWSNLSADMKKAYNADPDCIAPHCEWIPLGECSSQYHYFNPAQSEEVQELECDDSEDFGKLVWSQEQKTCIHCSEVFRRNKEGERTTDCCA